MSAPAQPHAWSVHASVEPTVDRSVVRIRGRLGNAGAEELRHALKSLALSGSAVHLDLADVDYISSAGLSIVRELAEEIHGRGLLVALVGASESVRLALRLAGAIPHLDTSRLNPDT